MNLSARYFRNPGSTLAGAGVLLVAGCLVGCTPSGGEVVPGTGGSGSGGQSAPGSGGQAQPGSGGASSPGSGGSPAGTGGAIGSGGGTPGSGGRAAGTGGAGTGGAGGRMTGTGGRAGSGGAAGGGGSAAPGAGDMFVSNVMVMVHPQVATLLNVTWMQTQAADRTWLEFTFTGATVMNSRAKPGAMGAHDDVVIGVPGQTAVTVRIVSEMGGVQYKTRDYMGTTGAVPGGMPTPMRLAYEPAAVATEKWILGSVENSTGGCANSSCIFNGTHWVFIMDREARIVWYYAEGTSRVSSSYVRIARDGEYIAIDKGRTGGTLGALKMTLDRKFSQMTNLQVSDAIDVTADGSILYETSGTLKERPNGSTTDRTIWSCMSSMYRARFNNNCYSNTVNWDPVSDTVLLSFPEPNTVLQIDRKATSAMGDAAIVAAWGDQGDWTFSPSMWSFEFQHFPNIIREGGMELLLISSHLPQFPYPSAGGPMQHAFIEFQIDRTAKRLTERWSYSGGTEWPYSRGGVIKLSNGNYLGQYGSAGAFREITPDKRTVFHVKFDAMNNPSDVTNKLIGHVQLVGDLYSLNGGPQ